ncbi:MAG: hypothetical protein Q9N32_03530 [Gammaproteobacteria bacterium]|nr:hypothetical protein [Gammaproteobacteria bacterium]
MKKLILLTASIGALATIPSISMADDAFFEALTSGKVSFSARARYESVSQDNALKDADAFTIRTTLGYKTGDFYGFKAFAVEDVTAVGSEKYNSLTNGETAYSVVADPDGTEIKPSLYTI